MATNYMLTKQAKEGYAKYGRYLHVEGYSNIISYIIWHAIDIPLIEESGVDDALKKCTINRLNYINKPERETCALTLDDETKQRFARIYVGLGISNISAALDLLGQAIYEDGKDNNLYCGGVKNVFFYNESTKKITQRPVKSTPECPVRERVLAHSFKNAPEKVKKAKRTNLSYLLER